MEHYIFHKAYIPKTRAEIISDTVELPPKKFNMPHMSSMDANFHAPQDLIFALHNPAPETPLLKLGNGHKEAFSNLAKIFRKANPSAVPLMVPVRGVIQEKLQEVNQEVTQIKIAPQSKPIPNAEPLRVSIIEAFPD